LVGGVEVVQASAVAVQATLVRFVREIDVRRTAAKHSATSAAVTPARVAC
jgi:hypothetical protein